MKCWGTVEGIEVKGNRRSEQSRGQGLRRLATFRLVGHRRCFLEFLLSPAKPHRVTPASMQMAAAGECQAKSALLDRCPHILEKALSCHTSLNKFLRITRVRKSVAQGCMDYKVFLVGLVTWLGRFATEHPGVARSC